jgi:phage/plasmid-associated DNA primase
LPEIEQLYNSIYSIIMLLPGSQTRQIELKARCNISTVDFLGKVWYYKHYNANFYKDPDNTTNLIGNQLAKSANGILVQCDYINNKSIESWMSNYQDIMDFGTELNDVDDFKYKPSKHEVYITSLSQGKWKNTNPRIWETNQNFYQIDETTQEIKSVINATDPIITGKSVTKVTKETKVDPSFLDSHIKAVMSLHDPRKYSKHLPEQEEYQFTEILQENRCCIPFVMVKKTETSNSIISDVKILMIRKLHEYFNIEIEENSIGFIRIPSISPLLENPDESAYILYCCKDLSIRFNSLTDQRKWWKKVQSDIDSKKEYSNFKYFKVVGNVYQQSHHINFDIYKEGMSIPILLFPTQNRGKLPVCPSFCSPNDVGGNNSNGGGVGSTALTFEFNDTYTSTSISFTKSQLENVLKITFPGIDPTSFRQECDNAIIFQRDNCLMGLLKDLEGHHCKELEASVIFNTIFKRTPANKDAICQLLYKCDCYPTSTGEPLTYITHTSCKKQKRKLEDDSDQISFEPVTLDEKLQFPESLNFEHTVKNTDVGFAKVFTMLYKNRYVYDPETQCFYYYDGNVWQCDKKGEFTDTIIASKLASCMDDHIRELEEEIDREESRQKQNKQLISSIRKRIKNCDDQRKRLTNGVSRVKMFVKIHMTDKYFSKKIEHPGKMAAFNGLIDLKTLDISPFNPKDYITDKGKFAYYKCSCKPGECMIRDDDGNIQCNSIIAKQMQKLDDIIREIMGCDCENNDSTLKYGTDLYYHFMWCIGYGLSGQGNKKYLMYCHSPANSGKSLVLEAITEILPQYFGVVPKGALFGRKSANGPTPELVLIIGKRAGFCDEVGKDDHFDDRNTKALTGRSKVEWRKMGGEYQVNKFKIVPFIAANQYMEIDCLDPAFWDRLMPILFPVHFARTSVDKDIKIGTERLRDETIVDKFETEAYQLAYFNWLVRSCAYYYNNMNKPIPKPIREKINELKKESFALDEFINNSEQYEFAENEKVDIKPFYDAFKKYAVENNIRSKMNYSLSQFRNMIREMSKESSGYERKISIDDNQGRTVKSMIKGIKSAIRVPDAGQDYIRGSRPASPIHKRPRNDGSGSGSGSGGGDDEDASVQPSEFAQPLPLKKKKIVNDDELF